MKSLLIICLAATTLALSSTTHASEATHRKAAEEFLQVMQFENTFSDAIDQQLDVQIKQSPEIAPFKGTMKAFFDKYMSWASLKDDFAKIYMDNFTEQELNELTAFYKTPVGQKAAKRFPELVAQGAEIGQRRVQEHLPELQKMIMEEMTKPKQ